jgi:hypothetical protein
MDSPGKKNTHISEPF